MSDEEYRTHEILLENRHLAVVGVGVLMLCLGSFLLGRWTEHRRWVNPDTPLPQVSGATEHLPIEPAFLAEEALRSAGPIEALTVEKRDEPEPAPPSSQTSLRPEPRAEKPPLPAAQDEDLYVQVLATRHEEAAVRLRERLSGRNYPATVISLPDSQGRMLFRVRVGGYHTREEAKRVAVRLENEERLKTWIP